MMMMAGRLATWRLATNEVRGVLSLLSVVLGSPPPIDNNHERFMKARATYTNTVLPNNREDFQTLCTQYKILNYRIYHSSAVRSLSEFIAKPTRNAPKNK